MADRTFQVKDTEAMLAVGGRVARALVESGLDALVIELRGDLGAGKTVFVRGLARGLGVPASAEVISPTFIIARAYPVEAGALRELHHVDAYRLRGPEELEAAGFEELCGTGRLTCVEWGENVAEAQPEDRVRLTLRPEPPEHLEPGAAPECPRTVTVTALGPRARALLDAWPQEQESRA